MTGIQIRTIIRPKYDDNSYPMYKRYRILLLATRITDDERRHDTLMMKTFFLMIITIIILEMKWMDNKNLEMQI